MEIQKRIQWWGGIDRYWKIILSSNRFKSLNESQRITDNLDTGYFASPAREKKIAQGVTSSTLSKAISGNKKSLAERLYLLRNHGLISRNLCKEFAYNSKSVLPTKPLMPVIRTFIANQGIDNHNFW